MLKIKKINDLSKSKIKKKAGNIHTASNSSLINNNHHQSTSSAHNNSVIHNQNKSKSHLQTSVHPTHQNSVNANHQVSLTKNSKNTSSKKTNKKAIGCKNNNVSSSISNLNLKNDSIQNYVKNIKNSLKVRKEKSNEKITNNNQKQFNEKSKDMVKQHKNTENDKDNINYTNKNINNHGYNSSKLHSNNANKKGKSIQIKNVNCKSKDKKYGSNAFNVNMKQNYPKNQSIILQNQEAYDNGLQHSEQQLNSNQIQPYQKIPISYLKSNTNSDIQFSNYEQSKSRITHFDKLQQISNYNIYQKNKKTKMTIPPQKNHNKLKKQLYIDCSQKSYKQCQLKNYPKGIKHTQLKNQAAIKIQKVFRGYLTRKLLSKYIKAEQLRLQEKAFQFRRQHQHQQHQYLTNLSNLQNNSGQYQSKSGKASHQYHQEDSVQLSDRLQSLGESYFRSASKNQHNQHNDENNYKQELSPNKNKDRIVHNFFKQVQHYKPCQSQDQDEEQIKNYSQNQSQQLEDKNKCYDNSFDEEQKADQGQAYAQSFCIRSKQLQLIDKKQVECFNPLDLQSQIMVREDSISYYDAHQFNQQKQTSLMRNIHIEVSQNKYYFQHKLQVQVQVKGQGQGQVQRQISNQIIQQGQQKQKQYITQKYQQKQKKSSIKLSNSEDGSNLQMQNLNRMLYGRQNKKYYFTQQNQNQNQDSLQPIDHQNQRWRYTHTSTSKDQENDLNMQEYMQNHDKSQKYHYQRQSSYDVSHNLHQNNNLDKDSLVLNEEESILIQYQLRMQKNMQTLEDSEINKLQQQQLELLHSRSPQQQQVSSSYVLDEDSQNQNLPIAIQKIQREVLPKINQSSYQLEQDCSSYHQQMQPSQKTQKSYSLKHSSQFQIQNQSKKQSSSSSSFYKSISFGNQNKNNQKYLLSNNSRSMSYQIQGQQQEQEDQSGNYHGKGQNNQGLCNKKQIFDQQFRQKYENQNSYKIDQPVITQISEGKLCTLEDQLSKSYVLEDEQNKLETSKFESPHSMHQTIKQLQNQHKQKSGKSKTNTNNQNDDSIALQQISKLRKSEKQKWQKVIQILKIKKENISTKEQNEFINDIIQLSIKNKQELDIQLQNYHYHYHQNFNSDTKQFLLKQSERVYVQNRSSSKKVRIQVQNNSQFTPITYIKDVFPFSSDINSSKLKNFSNNKYKEFKQFRNTNIRQKIQEQQKQSLLCSYNNKVKKNQDMPRAVTFIPKPNKVVLFKPNLNKETNYNHQNSSLLNRTNDLKNVLLRHYSQIHQNDQSLQAMMKFREKVLRKKQTCQMLKIQQELSSNHLTHEQFIKKLQAITKIFQGQKQCMDKTKSQIQNGYKATVQLIKSTLMDARHLGYNIPFCRSMEIFKNNDSSIFINNENLHKDNHNPNSESSSFQSWKFDKVMIDELDRYQKVKKMIQLAGKQQNNQYELKDNQQQNKNENENKNQFQDETKKIQIQDQQWRIISDEELQKSIKLNTKKLKLLQSLNRKESNDHDHNRNQSQNQNQNQSYSQPPLLSRQNSSKYNLPQINTQIKIKKQTQKVSNFNNQLKNKNKQFQLNYNDQNLQNNKSKSDSDSYEIDEDKEDDENFTLQQRFNLQFNKKQNQKKKKHQTNDNDEKFKDVSIHPCSFDISSLGDCSYSYDDMSSSSFNRSNQSINFKNANNQIQLRNYQRQKLQKSDNRIEHPISDQIQPTKIFIQNQQKKSQLSPSKKVYKIQQNLSVRVQFDQNQNYKQQDIKIISTSIDKTKKQHSLTPKEQLIEEINQYENNQHERQFNYNSRYNSINFNSDNDEVNVFVQPTSDDSLDQNSYQFEFSMRKAKFNNIAQQGQDTYANYEYKNLKKEVYQIVTSSDQDDQEILYKEAWDQTTLSTIQCIQKFLIWQFIQELLKKRVLCNKILLIRGKQQKRLSMGNEIQQISKQQTSLFLDILQKYLPTFQQAKSKLLQRMYPTPSQLLKSLRDQSEYQAIDEQYYQIGQFQFLISQQICQKSICYFIETNSNVRQKQYIQKQQVLQEHLKKQYQNYNSFHCQQLQCQRQLPKLLMNRQKFLSQRRQQSFSLHQQILKIEMHIILDCWNQEIIRQRQNKNGYSGIGNNQLYMSLLQKQSLKIRCESQYKQFIGKVKHRINELIINCQLSTKQKLQIQTQENICSNDSQWIMYVNQSLQYGLDLSNLVQEEIIQQFLDQIFSLKNLLEYKKVYFRNESRNNQCQQSEHSNQQKQSQKQKQQRQRQRQLNQKNQFQQETAQNISQQQYQYQNSLESKEMEEQFYSDRDILKNIEQKKHAECESECYNNKKKNRFQLQGQSENSQQEGHNNSDYDQKIPQLSKLYEEEVQVNGHDHDHDSSDVTNQNKNQNQIQNQNCQYKEYTQDDSFSSSYQIEEQEQIIESQNNIQQKQTQIQQQQIQQAQYDQSLRFATNSQELASSKNNAIPNDHYNYNKVQNKNEVQD